MAPKAKAKAKAKAAAKPQAGGGEEDQLPVPPPPPTPVPLKFPDAFSEENAAARCVLLTWRDRGNQYKLQSRLYMDEEKSQKDDNWTDLEQVQQRPMGSRADVYFVTGLQYARAEYRLALKNANGENIIDGKFVMNWFSAPSDPVTAVVDPPAKPLCEVITRGDYSNVAVQLAFRSTNPDAPDAASRDRDITDTGPWAGFPGVNICKVQTRWRALRHAKQEEILEQGGDAAAIDMFAGATDGEKRIGALVEVGSDCKFDASTLSWLFRFGEVPHGLLARFEVRIGTAYRWSAWSEESDDVPVVIPPPRPESEPGAEGIVNVVSTSDSTAKVQWEPFLLADGMTLCEYRVMVCQLAATQGGAHETKWDSASARVVGIFTVKSAGEPVEFEAKGLVADNFYLVKVDARYPFLGERGWSVHAITKDAAHTSFASRPPPLAPMPLPTNHIEQLVSDDCPFNDGQPWLALLVEHSAYEDYNVEFTKSFELGRADEGDEVQVLAGEWRPAINVVPLGIPHDSITKAEVGEGKAWMALAVLLGETGEPWESEVVTCRLRHRRPATVSPHLSTGSTSAPLVPKIVAPAHCSASVRWSSSLAGFGVLVRFYLGTAVPESAFGSDLLGVVADLRAAGIQTSEQETVSESDKIGGNTNLHLLGHRFITFYQVRIRPLSGEPAITLTPRGLTAPCFRNKDLQLGPLPEAVLEGSQAPAALVWDAGEQHEAWLQASDGFKLGSDYEVDIRVGTSSRWSPWATTCDQVSFALPVPKPLPGRPGRDLPAQLFCSITSPTSVVLRFAPFLLAPGAPEAQYLIAAIPSPPNPGEAAGEADDGESGPGGFASLFQRTGDSTQRCVEGAVPITTSVVAKRRAIKTDQQAVQSLFTKGSLTDLQEISQLTLLLHHESEEDLDLMYRAVEEDSIEVHLGGLLPATKYEFQVAARYMSDAQISTSLSVAVDTPCGAGPPAAPSPLPVDKIDSVVPVGLASRVAVLEIEERLDYVLECMGARVQDDEGWYPNQASEQSHNGKGKAGAVAEEAAHQWWNNAQDTETEAAAGEWHVVTTRELDQSSNPGFSVVAVDLPEFGTARGSARMNAEMPDLMWFRLRVAERVGSHPCRWVGNVGNAVVTCIAPIAAPPLPKRVYADASWHVKVSFFVHKNIRPSPVSVGEIRKATSSDSALSLFVDDSEEPALFDGETEHDRPDEVEGLEIPVGYGHRKVTWVQARAQLVGGRAPNGEEGSYRSMSRDWIELRQIPLGDCKASIPSSFKGAFAERAGELHKLSVIGTDSLREGGVYQVQIRLGNGYRWSAWSSSSRRFTYGVPQPCPVDGDLEVGTLSSNMARLKWPAFKVPDTLSEVEYLLKAKPTWASSSLQGVHVVCEAHVLTAEPPGDSLEAEISNLTPAIEYTFSISARYPRIGWRAWSPSMSSKPQALEDRIADWPAPPAPVVLPHNGPTPFALKESIPFFHPNERALLVGFPDTAGAPDGIEYQLEYKHVGLLEGSDRDSSKTTADLTDEPQESSAECANIWPVDYRTTWRTPIEVVPVGAIDAQSTHMLKALSSPWKSTPALWRVRLPGPAFPAGSDMEHSDAGAAAAQLQRVQLRLVTKSPGECPIMRWFSAPSPPICAGIAPPLNARAKLDIADSHLTVQVSFELDLRLAPGSFRAIAAGIKALKQLEGIGTDGEAMLADAGVPRQLPKGFCHGFAKRFQVRSRHSPRPPGEQPADRGRKPHGVPWSAWAESPDTDLSSTIVEVGRESLSNVMQHCLNLSLPDGIPLEYGSWYQVSFRISDGTCWSDWCEPSSPVKVFVAPPKPERPDTDDLSVDRTLGGSNVTIRWSPLRAHGGLRLVEYALFVREVLHDRTDICQRQMSALILGHAAKAELERRTDYENETPQKNRGEKMSFELRDLRQDVTYVFTLAARYPHIGPRDFEDALSSAPTSLRPGCAPLPVPMQLPLPPERLKRMQGMRCALLKYSLHGLPPATKESDEDHERHGERHYDLQALPEGAKDHEWVICKNVARTKIDGAVAWFVKDVPGQALRSRFRLWDRDTGRFGRTSPLMLTLVEPLTKLGVVRVIAESCSQLVLRAPLDAKHGSHEFVCRYQVRYRPEHVDSEWTELPIQMLWHRQNDHLATLDVPVDAAGAVISGLTIADMRHESLSKAVSFGSNLAREKAAAAHHAAEVAENKRISPEGNKRPSPDHDHVANSVGEETQVVRTPAFPAIPLATVGPVGDIARQHCLVAILREEDGLSLTQSYAFSVRVGDLYRLSDWSEPSAVVKLAVPPPMLSPRLSEDEARIRISDVTDTTLFATWPRFMPATNAGVPIHCEVEYLLVVAPQAPKRKVTGRGRPVEVDLHPHSHWLLTSTIPKGVSPENLEQDTLCVAVTGLMPYTAYELRLSVRYARLGIRKWSEALTLVAHTKKAEKFAGGAGAMSPGENADLSLLRKFEQKGRMMSGSLDMSKRVDPEIRTEMKPLSAESPRRLPPLEQGLASQRSLESPSAVEQPPLGTEPVAAFQSAELDEWAAVTQADAERIIGGMAVNGAAVGQVAQPARAAHGELGEAALEAHNRAPEAAVGGEEAAVGYPARPAEHVPFWRRDPMDVRPAMPMMPPASHSAMQLDLCGRERPWPAVAPGGESAGGSAIKVPRPPSSERPPGRLQRPQEDRTAYPRRFIYE